MMSSYCLMYIPIYPSLHWKLKQPRENGETRKKHDVHRVAVRGWLKTGTGESRERRENGCMVDWAYPCHAGSWCRIAVCLPKWNNRRASCHTNAKKLFRLTTGLFTYSVCIRFLAQLCSNRGRNKGKDSNSKITWASLFLQF